MNLNEWREKNRQNFGSDYEILFTETVLPLVPELSLDMISVQYPFQDTDKRQRYCDFVIHENDDVRIAIEIDGYDKKGTGVGMSHADFVDWQRRQAALTSQGWYVLRFANRDVRDEPKRCAEHISLLLKRSRSTSQHKALTTEEKARLDVLAKAQNNTIEHLNKDTFVMKYTIASFTTVILALVMVIVWQSRGGSFGQSQATMQSPVIQPQPVMLSAAHNFQIPKNIPEGATCDNPVGWQQAGQHIGQTVAVVGPLMKVTNRENIRGNPTWIDIGALYPNTERLVLVIWGEQKSEFPMMMPGQLEGRSVCIIGQIKNYKSTFQIELRTSSQLKVLQ
jgi:very-short-patch-repair endonuclease